jgi:hypothetical protein
MKTYKIDCGYITVGESKAICPHCERKIPFDEIEKKFIKQEKHFIKFKCKCKRFIGITSNIQGDYVAFEFNIKLIK